MPKPRFNQELKTRVQNQLPLAFARPEDPLLGATLTSALLVDGEARIDEGLLHARSDVQRGIRWTLPAAEMAPPTAKTYYMAWIAMKGGEGALYYHGLTISQMVIDRETRQGFRRLSQEVNAMGDAAAGRVDLDGLPADLVEPLARLLVEKGHGAWERSPEAFRTAFHREAERRRGDR